MDTSEKDFVPVFSVESAHPLAELQSSTAAVLHGWSEMSAHAFLYFSECSELLSFPPALWCICFAFVAEGWSVPLFQQQIPNANARIKIISRPFYSVLATTQRLVYGMAVMQCFCLESALFLSFIQIICCDLQSHNCANCATVPVSVHVTVPVHKVECAFRLSSSTASASSLMIQ